MNVHHDERDFLILRPLPLRSFLSSRLAVASRPIELAHPICAWARLSIFCRQSTSSNIAAKLSSVAEELVDNFQSQLCLFDSGASKRGEQESAEVGSIMKRIWPYGIASQRRDRSNMCRGREANTQCQTGCYQTYSAGNDFSACQHLQKHYENSWFVRCVSARCPCSCH